MRLPRLHTESAARERSMRRCTGWAHHAEWSRGRVEHLVFRRAARRTRIERLVDGSLTASSSVSSSIVLHRRPCPTMDQLTGHMIMGPVRVLLAGDVLSEAGDGLFVGALPLLLTLNCLLRLQRQRLCKPLHVASDNQKRQEAEGRRQVSVTCSRSRRSTRSKSTVEVWQSAAPFCSRHCRSRSSRSRRSRSTLA